MPTASLSVLVVSYFLVPSYLCNAVHILFYNFMLTYFVVSNCSIMFFYAAVYLYVREPHDCTSTKSSCMMSTMKQSRRPALPVGASREECELVVY